MSTYWLPECTRFSIESLCMLMLNGTYTYIHIYRRILFCEHQIVHIEAYIISIMPKLYTKPILIRPESLCVWLMVMQIVHATKQHAQHFNVHICVKNERMHMITVWHKSQTLTEHQPNRWPIFRWCQWRLQEEYIHILLLSLLLLLHSYVHCVH